MGLDRSENEMLLIPKEQGNASVALRQVKRKGGILRHAAGRELGQVVLEWCTSHARSMSRVGGGVLCDVVWCVTSISSCLQL